MKKLAILVCGLMLLMVAQPVFADKVVQSENTQIESKDGRQRTATSLTVIGGLLTAGGLAGMLIGAAPFNPAIIGVSAIIVVIGTTILFLGIRIGTRIAISSK